jgi:hypothetical protein
MHDQLSEVLSLEQSDEGIGSPFETFHNILAVFDLSGAEPFRHLFLKMAEMGAVIVKYDESLHAYPINDAVPVSDSALWLMAFTRLLAVLELPR